jgi:MFS family permease
MSRLMNWEEAARRPARTVIFMVLAGLVGGGLYGYFAFGHSEGWGLAFGILVALVLGVTGWRIVRDPARVAELSRQPRLEALKAAAPRLVAALLVVLALAWLLFGGGR